MKIGITGHAKIEHMFSKDCIQNGTIYDQYSYDKVYKDISKFLDELIIEKSLLKENIILISGMARGVDEIFAKIAMERDYKLILEIPHSIVWHKNRSLSRGIKSQALDYENILKYKNIVAINEVKKNYDGKKWKYANFARNQKIIDDADIVVSYKGYDSAGTNHAIASAKSCNKYYGNIPDLISIKDSNLKSLFDI